MRKSGRPVAGGYHQVLFPIASCRIEVDWEAFGPAFSEFFSRQEFRPHPTKKAAEPATNCTSPDVAQVKPLNKVRVLPLALFKAISKFGALGAFFVVGDFVFH